MNKYAKNATASPVTKMADGGSVGLFERLAAGNVDDPSSEAYKRWGAGSKAKPEAADAPAPAPRASSEPERTRMSEANTSDPQSDTSESDAETTRESRRSSPASAPKPAVKSQAPKKTPAKAPSAAQAASVNRQAVTGGYAGSAAAAAAKPAETKGFLARAFSLGDDFNKLPPGKRSIYDSGASTPKPAPAYSGSGPGIPVDVDAWKKQKVEDDRGRRGMANGGMVGGCGRSYGKKG